jgi:NADH:ubiquinone oxidoreductase subunit 4 (subunit M)
MVRKVFYGEAKQEMAFKDLGAGEAIALLAIVILILISGFYPAPLLQLGTDGLHQVSASLP